MSDNMKRVECVDAVSTVTSGLKDAGEIYYISNILKSLQIQFIQKQNIFLQFWGMVFRSLGGIFKL